MKRLLNKCLWPVGKGYWKVRESKGLKGFEKGENRFLKEGNILFESPATCWATILRWMSRKTYGGGRTDGQTKEQTEGWT